MWAPVVKVRCEGVKTDHTKGGLQNPMTSATSILTHSDETPFSIITDDDHHRQCYGERINPANVVERHIGITPGIMVWGIIGYDLSMSHSLSGDPTGTAQILSPPEKAPWYSHSTNQHPSTYSTRVLHHVEVHLSPAGSSDLSLI